MYIKLDTNNFIIGYAVIGGIQGGIEVADIPQNVKENPKAYKYINGKFVFDDSKIKEKETHQALQEEIIKIKQWFIDNDYKTLKVFRGNWLATDERYIQYLADYQIKKSRIDEIKIILNVEEE